MMTTPDFGHHIQQVLSKHYEGEDQTKTPFSSELTPYYSEDLQPSLIENQAIKV
jgi:hypothetical protein